MKQFLFWLKKYFVILLAFGLVIGAALMSIDFKSLVKVDEVIGQGNGENVEIGTREEFDALLYDTVEPLLAKALGEEVGRAPMYQSIAMYLSDISSDVVGEDGEYANYEENYILAVLDGAIYLSINGLEDEGDQSWSEYYCERTDYYFVGEEVYARIIQYDFKESGYEYTVEDLKEDPVGMQWEFGADMTVEGYIQLVRGDLFQKWVRITDVGMAKEARNELDYVRSIMRDIYQEGMFYAGKEPKIVRESSYISRVGEVFQGIQEGHSDDADACNITTVLQFKYINNTVIEDITAGKIYDIRDYM